MSEVLSSLGNRDGETGDRPDDPQNDAVHGGFGLAPRTSMSVMAMLRQQRL